MNAPLEMNPEIRARWAAALRSGDYEQGRDNLRRGDKFCCLGVLCDLAIKDGEPVSASEIAEADGGAYWGYDGHPYYLPASVREWAGLTCGNPEVEVKGVDGLSWATLAAMNDDQHFSFARIADAIDGGAS